MDTRKEERIAQLAEAGLAACLLKLSFAAPGEWKLEDVAVSGGPPADWDARAVAVRVTVSSEPPFSTALFFSEGDLPFLASCFADARLQAAVGDRVTILEIGNIVLNALVNALLKALGKSAIPSVPSFGSGPAEAGAARAAAGRVLVISAAVSAVRGGRSAGLRVGAVLPLTLAAKL